MFEGLSAIHLLFILAIAAVELGIPILALVLIIRYVQSRSRPDARAILAERLARGEITREQFGTAMHALGLSGAAGPTAWGANGAAQPGSTTWSGRDHNPPTGG